MLLSVVIKANAPVKVMQTTAAVSHVRLITTRVSTTTAESTTKVETTTNTVETSNAMATIPVSTSSDIVDSQDPDTPKIKKYFEPHRVQITRNEFETICSVVMREVGAEYGHVEGCYAVAQCILEGMLREKITATRLLVKYGYKPEEALERAAEIPPNQKTKDAVYRVFYEGYGVTPSPITVYYNPNICGERAEFEKDCIYHFEIDGNKFYEQK